MCRRIFATVFPAAQIESLGELAQLPVIHSAESPGFNPSEAPSRNLAGDGKLLHAEAALLAQLAHDSSESRQRQLGITMARIDARAGAVLSSQ